MPASHASVSLPLGGGTLVLETGKLAKQAHGAVTVRFGDSVVLVAAVEGNTIPGRDFFPLQVEYRERTYAAGKFPGGFIKRETRPSTKETLTSRLIDRPTRPLFPVGYVNEVQIHCTVVSADPENDTDVLALIGASAALHVSHIPFLKPHAGVRLGRVDGKLVVLPTFQQMENSDLDLIVAGTDEAVVMIEGFAREMPENEAGDAIVEAHRQCKLIIGAIHELREKAGLGKKVLPDAPPADDKDFDPEDGALALLQAQATHDNNLTSYRAEAAKFLKTLDPLSEANMACFSRALQSLTSETVSR